MVSPIRIAGSGAAVMPRSTAGVPMFYRAPDGEAFQLSASSRSESRALSVLLKRDGVSGLVGRVERGERESVSRYGVRSSGWKVPPLEITLAYWVRGPRGGLGDVMRRWRKVWDFEESGDYADLTPVKEGRLEVVMPGDTMWTPVTSPVFPDWPDSLAHRQVVEEEMACRGLLGHWFGETRTYTGTVTIEVPGDRPLSPKLSLLWDGTATSVKFPSGGTVNFPALGSARRIDLDRGMSGQVTRMDGSVDTLVWSGLQGTVHGMSLRPDTPYSWVLGSGMTLEVTPRYLDPWRR